MSYEKANIRIRYNGEGFIVQIQKTKWSLFGLKKYWIPLISYMGAPERYYPFSTREAAERETMVKIVNELKNINAE